MVLAIISPISRTLLLLGLLSTPPSCARPLPRLVFEAVVVWVLTWVSGIGGELNREEKIQLLLDCPSC